MLLNNKTVAIVGAGPVGLTMAKLLQQKGIAVTVYERDIDPQTRIWGGTLDLHKGSGQDALAAAGLLQAYYDLAIPMGRTIADEQGKILSVKKTTPEEQYDNPEINRNDLKKLMLDSLKKDTVVWDYKFTGLDAQQGKWHLHFENKADEVADIVIGANGGMSKLRSYVSDATIEYTGTFIIQGDVSQAEINCKDFLQRCNNNILMVANKGNLLVANPKNANVLSYSVIFKTPQEWLGGNGLNFSDTNSIAALLSKRLHDWAACYHELFSATSFFVGLPTRKIPLNNAWKNNRTLPITLIGDAAHIMPPFAGQGVNIGLMDAMILSDNLTSGKFETIAAAISDYEQQMWVYANEAQQETAENEIAMRDINFSFEKLMR